MKKILIIALIILSVCVYGAEKGKILWPQITDAIYKSPNEKVMDIEIGEDGLTVTDKCWDTYQRDDCYKRWNIDLGDPMDVPLKNYKFDKSYAGLPVNITVELYSKDNYYNVKETYQEIIILGGKQKEIKFPGWFSVPTNRLAYDFDENKKWPKGWTLPKGKMAIWQGAAKVRQKDINNKSTMLNFGFTHIGPCAVTKEGIWPQREQLGQVFSDNEWVKSNPAGTVYEDPTNPETWQVLSFLEKAQREKIIIADFEVVGSHAWQDYQFEGFKKIVDETREKYPDTYVGCWGVAPVRSSIRMFDDIDEQGRGSGVVNLTAAKKWRDLYNDPSAYTHSVFKRCNLNFGNPSIYFINNGKPSQLYAFLQEFEMSKILRPEVPDIMSTWIQCEFVDGYPLSSYAFKDINGKDRVEHIKHQVPASMVYALSLFGHTCMDGLHCWEVGTYYSEELSDYSNWTINELVKKININGNEYPTQYYMKYFGFYNYHVLGMWQSSQNKDIIEADTKWIMPEYISDKNNVWRVGDEVYPSFANFYKEPLLRAKVSQNKKEVLVVADNPYNVGLETVKVRFPEYSKKEFTIKLVGSWPQILRFKFN
ncbi:MAG: hypothetical protein KBT47_07675 [Armatimonadetes bacterium]|nr:hypothetical protein [Candidatus Hippobium faecium]